MYLESKARAEAVSEFKTREGDRRYGTEVPYVHYRTTLPPLMKKLEKFERIKSDSS